MTISHPQPDLKITHISNYERCTRINGRYFLASHFVIFSTHFFSISFECACTIGESCYPSSQKTLLPISLILCKQIFVLFNHRGLMTTHCTFAFTDILYSLLSNLFALAFSLIQITMVSTRTCLRAIKRPLHVTFIWSKSSVLTQHHLKAIAEFHGLSLDKVRIHTSFERAHHPSSGFMSISCYHCDAGDVPPISKFFNKFVHHVGVVPLPAFSEHIPYLSQAQELVCYWVWQIADLRRNPILVKVQGYN